MPDRIQLRRAKGWRLPPGAVHVARPSRWGNPWTIPPGLRGTEKHECTETAVAAFRDDLLAGRLEITVDDVRDQLAGRTLACWCPIGEPCHADVLIEIANAQETADA